MSCYPRAGSPDGVDAEALGAGGAWYQQWDWPVIVHRGQVRLSRSREASALAIPVTLGTEVTQILTQRRCAPAVLAHSYAPEHQIVLTGERYGVMLPWPAQAHRVTGVLLLPPPSPRVGRSPGDTLRDRTPCDCAAKSIFSGRCAPR